MRFIDQLFAKARGRELPVAPAEQMPSYNNPPMSSRFRDASQRAENYAYGGPNIDGYSPYKEDFGMGVKGNREHARCLQLMRALSTGNTELASTLLRINNIANVAHGQIKESLRNS